MARADLPTTAIDVEIVAAAAAEWGVWRDSSKRGKEALSSGMIAEMQARYGALKPQLVVAHTLLVNLLPTILPQARVSEFLAAVETEQCFQRDVAWVSLAARGSLRPLTCARRSCCFTPCSRNTWTLLPG
jgi:hypothetical protein